MDDALTRVLDLVAAGRLSAEEAGPILDALSARGDAATRPGRAGGGAETTSRGASGSEPGRAGGADRAPAPDDRGGPKFARIEVRENGRRVVDLRIPTSLGRFALGRVPGLSSEQIGELQNAIATGLLGPLLDVEDSDGDGVRIVLE